MTSKQGALIASSKTTRSYPGRRVRFAVTVLCTFVLNQVRLFLIVAQTGGVGGALEYQVSFDFAIGHLFMLLILVSCFQWGQKGLEDVPKSRKRQTTGNTSPNDGGAT